MLARTSAVTTRSAAGCGAFRRRWLARCVLCTCLARWWGAAVWTTRTRSGYYCRRWLTYGARNGCSCEALDQHNQEAFLQQWGRRLDRERRLHWLQDARN